MKATKLLISLLAAVAAISVTGSPALAADATIEDLQAQIAALQEKVEQLEASTPAQIGQTPLATPNQNSWDPLAEMDRMQAEMNRLFRHAFTNPGFSAAGSGMFRNSMVFDNSFNLDETDTGYKITFDIQGYDRDKIDISIHDQTLTISGQQSQDKEETGPEAFMKSQSFGSFMRTVQLPSDADTEKMQTSRNGDRLVISIPKKA